MTREQALVEFEEAGRMIDSLQQKRANLKKIIFAEQLTPTVMRRATFGVRGPRGTTRQIVLKAMAEYGKPLSMKEVEELTGLRIKQVHSALYGALKQHLVNHEKRGGRAIWSMAVHRDRSELNHL